ncbi:HET-domain-containing protein [Jackrogersella minutella]|nr:HET-domain-containing protein [Jackrogersella minutella]
MSSIPVIITGTLCELCHQFISNLFAFDFTKQEQYPAHWNPVTRGREWSPEKPWGDAFHHHETLQDLAESAKTCGLCEVLHADLAPMDSDLHQGWLGLYPFWSSGYIGENKLKGFFRAGFLESLTKMPRGTSKIGGVLLHSFRICRRGPLKEGEDVPWLDAYRRLPAVLPTLHLSNISQMVDHWQRGCREVHKNCAKLVEDYELPTRVIDVGEDDTHRIRLFESKGKKAPYTTLSHCWGGSIPSVTTEDNKAARYDEIDSDKLPQNFKDAIQITRALGIRYVWIDALCIIQDSKADWFREAGKMSTVYAGATVVISALDAAASTVGFLKPERLPTAVINDEYAVQKRLPELNDYLQECPLVNRGWCMQERLLAPRLLHFGKEQMFWECYSEFNCEDGRMYTGDSDGHVVAEFIKNRKHIGVFAAQGTELEWRAWYQLLEEYTTRKFTVSTDKLPALSGAASLFKSTRPAATYVAGLWKENIAQGILWCAHYYHVPGRKVWGISTTDKIAKLAKPPEKRAPSWSWASVDGQLDFWTLRIGGFVVEVLDVVMSLGENELTEPFPEGTIKLRGLVAHMFYHAPDKSDQDVGTLTFQQLDSPSDESTLLKGCVMDLDRHSSRFCWAILISRSNDDWYLLVLAKNDDGSYQRIGMVTAHNVKIDEKRFETREVQIV